MKVAITGASGYVGRYLIEELDKDNNIEKKLLSRKDIGTAYTVTDYCSNDLEYVFKNVDAVIHLAANKNIRTYAEMEKNISLTDVVVESAKNAGVSKIIYASSISVYGEEEHIPWTEDMVPEPLSLYGLSKLASEEVLRIKANQSNIQYICLRLAHIIGSDMPGNYMIPTFLRNASKNLSVSVIGKSIAKRELIDVLDAARALHWALLSDNANNMVINIGTGIGLTNLEIAKIIEDESGIDVEYDDTKPEGIQSSVMCVEKAKALGFTAQNSPEEALRRIVKNQSKSFVGEKVCV